MNIISLNGWNNLPNLDPNVLRAGQRIYVEILHLDHSGQGWIKLDGQELKAVLANQGEARPGDKFWAVIQERGVNGLVLTKDVTALNLNGEQLLDQEQVSNREQVSRQGQFLSQDRGLQQDAVEKAQKTSWETLLPHQLPRETTSDMNPESAFLEKLLRIIPHWSEFNGEDGSAKIYHFLRQLGLDYERRLWQMTRLEAGERESQAAELKNTVKAHLLVQVQEGEGNQGQNDLLHALLEHLNGLQAGLLRGREDSYLWFNLPLQTPHRIFNAKIAVQSGRRENKVDPKHCRIGISVETAALGKIGVDAYFYENRLSLRILATAPEEVSSFVEEVKQETISRFSELGLKLMNISVGSTNAYPEFERFVSGQPQQGVDHYV